ncbi:MAG: 4Fe-4S dicluster domain-containing protein [bacterium]|nr:4Fe-4S dicluster domain-containing protein [bacterium]
MSGKNGISRRSFLKVVGAGSGIAVAGCSSELPEKIIPYVIQPDEVIPGVSTWYSGTCTSCSAGCGVVVRTREGRAVKLEGSTSHPISQGGLCARGQSTLQDLYNPDRLREPLARETGKPFLPVKWQDAVGKISAASSSGVAVVGRPLTGSISSLLKDYLAATSGRYYSFEPTGRSVLEKAAELAFGPGARVSYDFSAADTVVSIGADYLETWDSPVENSRGWAARRDQEKTELSYTVHFEPRLSLTAANADKWAKIAPGSEKRVLLALLKAVLNDQAGNVPAIAAKVRELTYSVILSSTGVTEQQVKTLANRLRKSVGLVVAGGAGVNGREDAESVVALAHLINAEIGSVGRTLLVHQAPKTEFTGEKGGISALLGSIAAGEVKTLIINDVNIVYQYPSDALTKALAAVPLVVYCGMYQDETAELAHVVLPLSSSLESWSDSEPRDGVKNLNQPAMQPLYQTQGFGDILLALLAAGKIKIAGEVTSYHQYLQQAWKDVVVKSGKSWLELVQQGGSFSKPAQVSSALQVGAISTSLTPLPEGLVVLAFPTVLSTDGGEANRPWMQEVPDPLTSSVWGSWIEMHPELASFYGFQRGDYAVLHTDAGEVEGPVYVTERIHPRAVALPAGKGHRRMGRYADGVGGNAFKLLALAKSGDRLLSATSLRAERSITKSAFGPVLCTTQGSDTQLGRDILRKTTLSQIRARENHKQDSGKHTAEHKGQHGEGHEAPGQMYLQMEHPLYKWEMAVDLARCTGCSACVVACYAENNVPIVGREQCEKGREMSWIRVDRYFADDRSADQPVEGFQPMMCQHCNHAPCEPVCPVYATYHTEEGTNNMVYNRCVGTRYCANNCSYKVRRFNWFRYMWPEPLTWQLNPDVTVREVGVMEKCSFCAQRLREAKNNAKNLGRTVLDGEAQPACASSCPTKAITFGNALDSTSLVKRKAGEERAYRALDHELNTQPAVSYLARISNDSVKL